ncbi:MAG: COG4648 family protein [Acidiferrobacter sp.]
MGVRKTGTWLRRARIAGGGALVVAYSAISYRSNVAGHAGTLGVLFAFAPLLALSLGAAWRGRPRLLWLALWAMACGGLWHDRALIAAHYAWAYLVEDVGMLTLLCSFFARTLAPPRVPLISRLSELVHGSLSPRLAHYTRRVTQLWAALFGVMAIVSVFLFLVAGVRVWGFYANVLTWPIMALVFIGEYLVRRRVIPAQERAGFLQVVFAGSRYWRHLVDTDPREPSLHGRAGR